MGDFQQSAQQKLYTHLQTALEMLAKRVLGEPYNMHTVDAAILPAMLNDGLSGKIIAECQRQFRAQRQYTPATIAAALRANPSVEVVERMKG